MARLLSLNASKSSVTQYFNCFMEEVAKIISKWKWKNGRISNNKQENYGKENLLGELSLPDISLEINKHISKAE